MSERATVTSTATGEEWRGPVLDVVRQLLEKHERKRELLAIFDKLVSRNSELELQLSWISSDLI
jgi:hypothetical protein